MTRKYRKTFEKSINQSQGLKELIGEEFHRGLLVEF